MVKAQVIQEATDRFTVLVMTTGLTSTERQLIRERMESQLGSIQLPISEVDDIPVGSNGKFKAVISRIKQPLATT